MVSLDVSNRVNLSVVAEDNCSKLSMSESHPDDSPQNDLSDARNVSDMTMESADGHGTKPDTFEIGNGPVAEETLNVDQQALESSAAREDLPEDPSMAQESVKEQDALSSVLERAAPRQEEEFVVVQLTDGQQVEAQGTTSGDILSVLSRCINIHRN